MPRRRIISSFGTRFHHHIWIIAKGINHYDVTNSFPDGAILCANCVPRRRLRKVSWQGTADLAQVRDICNIGILPFQRPCTDNSAQYVQWRIPEKLTVTRRFPFQRPCWRAGPDRMQGESPERLRVSGLLKPFALVKPIFCSADGQLTSCSHARLELTPRRCRQLRGTSRATSPSLARSSGLELRSDQQFSARPT